MIKHPTKGGGQWGVSHNEDGVIVSAEIDAKGRYDYARILLTADETQDMICELTNHLDELRKRTWCGTPMP